MSPSTPLFDIDGQPLSALVELLDLYGVTHDGTLKGIHGATQTAWYEAGKLRAQITEKHGHKKEQALPLFQRLGFMDMVQAPRLSYLHCLLLGATVVAVRKRLALLRSEWERGLRFYNLWLLGSDRPLLADKESASVVFNADNAEFPFRRQSGFQMPSNETDMMFLVYEQVRSLLPWRGNMSVGYVTAKGQDGRNASTADTLREWNKLSLTGGRCLVVSSQPFVSYQGLVARKALSQRHDVVDAIGYASPDLPVTTYLDNIAKIVHELYENRRP